MNYLSKSDLDLFAKGMFGNAPAVVSKQLGIRQQGNGNFTGIERTNYADGTHTDHEFIVNAKSREDAAAAYLGNH